MMARRKQQPAPVVRSVVSVRAVDAKEHLFSLTRMQRECFPKDGFASLHTGYWVMAFVNQIHPIGFAVMNKEPLESCPDGTGSIDRVGVMPGHRGKNLMVRLIKRCEAHAAKQGWSSVIATTYDNPAASNNFMYAGWTAYEPQEAFAAPGTVYWTNYLRSGA